MNACSPFRWAWGLIPVFLIAFLVIAGEGPKIEQDLTKRVSAALQDEGYYWAQVRFNGRDGVLTGTAVSPSERSAAVEMVSGIRGVGTVQDRAKLLPAVSPYTWWATREGTRIRIKGHVPTQADRQTILGIVKATMPDLEIDDRMKLASGAPPKQRWLGAISFALNQLGHLKVGSARLSDLELDVTGEASSEAAYNAVRNARTAQLPAGLMLKKHIVVPPRVEPYTWAVQYRSGTVKITGHVPSDEMRRDMLENAKKTFSDTVIEDGMTLGSGAPEQWRSVVLLVFAQLARLEEGGVTVEGNELAIEGLAADAETAADVAKTVRGALPPPFKSVEKVGVRRKPEPDGRPSGNPEKTMALPPRSDRGESRSIFFGPKWFGWNGGLPARGWLAHA